MRSGSSLSRRRRRPHAEQAVFAVQEDVAVLRQVIGDQRRQADAQVDVRAFGNVAGDAGGHLVAAVTVHRDVPRRRLAVAIDRDRRVDRDDALDEDSRRDDVFRVEAAQRDHFAHLRDRALGRAGHDRPEIARGLAIDEVAPAVALLGLDQREVGVDRILEHVVAAVDDARFLAFGQQRAVAGGREKGADARTGGADALGEVALRHQFQFDLAGAIQRVEHVANPSAAETSR